MEDQTETQGTRSPSSLVFAVSHRAEMVAHCLRALPEEGCGLLIGELLTGRVAELWLVSNAAHSVCVDSIDPLDLLRADRAAEVGGKEIIGVFHSHTHTDPYPSPTDVSQAPDPSWHYVIVSLRFEVPSIRSYRIANGVITEEPLIEPTAD